MIYGENCKLKKTLGKGNEESDAGEKTKNIT